MHDTPRHENTLFVYYIYRELNITYKYISSQTKSATTLNPTDKSCLLTVML
jgi:hypothetical protein